MITSWQFKTMKYINEIYEFLHKNIKEITHFYDYRIIKVKKNNSKKLTMRLAKQKSGQEALFDAPPELIKKNKYFTVQVDAKPGINHLREALNWLVRESVSLNRTPLVFTPYFDSIHNFDIEINATWDKYIDLNNILIKNISLDTSIPIQAVLDKDIPNIDDLSTLWIERDHILTDKENEEFDLIIRHNKTGLEIDGVHTGVRGLPNYSVNFMPSNRIMKIYNQVSNQLHKYCAVHVRRGDMLGMTDLYPHLDHDTQPDQIRATLSQILPQGEKVYILTNERDKSYFNPLKNNYDILQYFDFQVLNELIDCEQPDNFLLFEIEKLIFDNADIKIYTFTHPEGGQRTSLSKHLGWA